MTVNADVVNAFVDPLVDVIRSVVGIDAQPAGLGVTEHLDPPPSLVCTIEMTGRLVGPITWVFNEDLARLFAGRLLATDALEPVEKATCLEAVAELANIISGNATGKLLEAGYEVDILPPRIHLDEDRGVIERALVVWLDTELGRIKIIIGVNVVEGP